MRRMIDNAEYKKLQTRVNVLEEIIKHLAPGGDVSIDVTYDAYLPTSQKPVVIEGPDYDIVKGIIDVCKSVTVVAHPCAAISSSPDIIFTFSSERNQSLIFTHVLVAGDKTVWFRYLSCIKDSSGETKWSSITYLDPEVRNPWIGE